MPHKFRSQGQRRHTLAVGMFNSVNTTKTQNHVLEANLAILTTMQRVEIVL